MKKVVFTFSFLFAVFIVLSGFHTPPKDDKVVTLSDVSSSLKMYQGNEQYDFVGDTIVYKEVDKVDYDRVFRESAIIYATIVQVGATVDGLNSNKIPTDAEFAVATIGFAVKDLPDMKDRIDNLLNALKSLNPKSDFKGLEMKKAPKATEGINMAKKQLTVSADRLPKLLEDVNELSKKVIK